MLILTIPVSCKIKKNIDQKVDEKTKTERTDDIESIITYSKRPALNFSHSQVLAISDGIIKPVFKRFEQDGVVIEFEVDEANELNAKVLIPSDTIKKTTTNQKSVSSQEINKSKNIKSKTRFGVSDWTLFIIIAIAVLILYLIINNIKPW